MSLIALDPTAATSSAAAPTSPRAGRRWAIGAAVAVALLLLGTMALWAPGLPGAARLVLMVFGLAMLGWTVLRLPETPVALAAALALVLLGVVQPERLYASLGDGLVWLLIGAFMLAAALQHSGVVERWTWRLLRGSGSTRALFHRLNLMVFATAFVVPSTSARAALLLPVFVLLAQALGRRPLVLALALLFPTLILLSAAASLLGAGAHLVALDFLRHQGLAAPGFGSWLMWAGPVAAVSCVLATELILCLMLGRDERRLQPLLPPASTAAASAQQRRIVGIALLTLGLWCTGGWHGIDMPIVALAAALAVSCKPLTGLDMGVLVKRVEWNLILFMAATLLLGHAMLDSGAAAHLAQAAMARLQPQRWSAPVVAAVVALVALLSHLVITSRTARAVVLLPTVALPMAAAGVDTTVLVMLCVLGSGFCQTFVASAKPVAVFARADVLPAAGIAPVVVDRALLRVSAWLLLPMASLLLLCAWLWWPLLAAGVTR
jgi:solute carrier family 13 (sodium-dependent dicarboxylate transporter), member 2/3/5